MMQAHIEIEGMSCAHCVASVRRALEQLPGVDLKGVEVGSATVAYDPEAIQPAQIAAAIEAQGYQAAVVGN